MRKARRGKIGANRSMHRPEFAAMRWTALVCFALAAAPAFAESDRADAAGDMTFRRIDAPNLCRRCDVVQASGAIASETPKLFDEFLARERIGGKPLHLIIDSRGGKVLAGWSLGRKLRAMRASVIAGKAVDRPDGAIELRPGLCVSMCNSVLAAGIERRISPGTLFGVHQFSPTGENFRNLDNAVTVRDMRGQLKMVSEWLAYAREMRIDMRLVEAQLHTPFEKVDFIAPDTLVEWKVVTAPAATLPKLLRNPRPGLEAVAAQPAANAAQAQSVATTQAPRLADRQWTPARQSGEWRETMMESDADFLRITLACAPNGRYGAQITLRGLPEARQKTMAQQIIAAGGFDLLERPIDISQLSIGFGGAFWIRAALRPDHVARLLGAQGQIAFALLSPDGAPIKASVVHVRTIGFADVVQPMLAACAARPQSERSAARAD